MGGSLCKHICKRPNESGDALDLANRPKVPEALAAPPAAPARAKDATQTAPAEVVQVGIDRSADYKAAQQALVALEAAPGHQKAAAWAACEKAWDHAVSLKQLEDDKSIADLVASTRPGWFSFEYFPPKTDAGVLNLTKRIQRMKALGPLFVDFTWGAGGSTSDLTLKLTSEAKNQLGCVANMHLTCTNQGASMVEEALANCRAVGVRNIVALRGDPPRGQEKWTATEGGFNCALDLVRFIRMKHGDYFCVAVAGYPEGHPDVIEEVPGGLGSLSPTEQCRARVVKDKSGKEVVTVCRDAAFEKEMAYLKEKVDAGAGLIITQMFLDTQVYVDFVAACRQCGISVPVIPGIMMLNTLGGLQRMTALCKTRLPEGLLEKAEAANSSDDSFKAFGVEFATDMCRALLDGGAPGLHFYTLNLEKVVVGTLLALKLITEEQAKACTAGDGDAKTMVSAQGITTGTPKVSSSAQ